MAALAGHRADRPAEVPEAVPQAPARCAAKEDQFTVPLVTDLVCEYPAAALRLQLGRTAGSGPGGGSTRARQCRDVPGNQRGTSAR
jgi:hypothetical protein